MREIALSPGAHPAIRIEHGRGPAVGIPAQPYRYRDIQARQYLVMIHGEHTANRDCAPSGVRIDRKRITGGPDTIIPGDLAKPVAAVPERRVFEQTHRRYLCVHSRSDCICGVAVIVCNLSW